MKLSIVLSTHAAQFQAATFKGDLASNLAKIADWGYNGVELAIRDPGLVDTESLLRMVSAQGLEVTANNCFGTAEKVREVLDPFFLGLRRRPEEVKQRCCTELQREAESPKPNQTGHVAHAPHVVSTMVSV